MTQVEQVDESATATEIPAPPKPVVVRGRIGGSASDAYVMTWLWNDEDGSECRLSSPRLPEGVNPPKRPDGGVGYRVVFLRKSPGRDQEWQRQDTAVICRGTPSSFAQCVREIVPHTPD